MSSKPTYKILHPMNCKDRRFLRAINKIRLFFYDDPINCIPCTTDFMKIIFGTKNMKANKVKLISYLPKIDFMDTSFSLNIQYYIYFNGSKDKRMKLLADYLRTEVVTLKNGKHAVRLPHAISNFIRTCKIERYIYSKFSSLEEQVKYTYGSFEEYKKKMKTTKD